MPRSTRTPRSTRAPRFTRLSWGLLLCLGLSLGNQPTLSSAAAPPTAPAADQDWVRTSQYITVRDATRLAIDIYRPAAAGVPLDSPLPVILEATPYHRSELKDGMWESSILQSWLPLLRRGYVIAALDIRGRGASFGTIYAGGLEQDTNHRDLWDVIEWLAAQPWSNGKVAMGGCSYDGLTQLWAVEAMPPHLKAIAPCATPAVDRYGANLRVNGVSIVQLVKNWDTAMIDKDITHPAPPVDEDQDGALLRAAIAEHAISHTRGLAAWAPARAAQPFRDSLPTNPAYAHSAADGWNYLANFRLSKIPVLQFIGWRDPNLEQALVLQRSLVPTGTVQRLIIGPWYHCAWYASDLFDATGEQIRWYDFWLKDQNSGLLQEPQIRYYLQGAPPGKAWRSTDQWPLRKQIAQTFSLAGAAASGPRTFRASGARGKGARDKGAGGEGTSDNYVVDYTTSATLQTRFSWQGSSEPNPGLKPIDTTARDNRSLIYTSPAVAHDVELTGTPTVTLWVSSTAADQDFFVYLEEVDEQGKSTLLTDGAIRASNRVTRTAPFENLVAPWHPSFAADQQPLQPGVPAKLEFALNPMSNYITKGHRFRIAINSFDAPGVWDTPLLTPAPVVTVFHDSAHRSTITLPFIDER